MTSNVPHPSETLRLHQRAAKARAASPKHLLVQQPCAQTALSTLEQFLLPPVGFRTCPFRSPGMINAHRTNPERPGTVLLQLSPPWVAHALLLWGPDQTFLVIGPFAPQPATRKCGALAPLTVLVCGLELLFNSPCTPFSNPCLIVLASHFKAHHCPRFAISSLHSEPLGPHRWCRLRGDDVPHQVSPQTR